MAVWENHIQPYTKGGIPQRVAITRLQEDASGEEKRSAHDLLPPALQETKAGRGKLPVTTHPSH